MNIKDRVIVAALMLSFALVIFFGFIVYIASTGEPSDLTPGVTYRPPSNMISADCGITSTNEYSSIPRKCISPEFKIHDPRKYGLSDKSRQRNVWIRHESDALLVHCNRSGDCLIVHVVKNRFL